MRCQRMRVFKVVMSLLRIGSIIPVFKAPGREMLDSGLGILGSGCSAMSPVVPLGTGVVSDGPQSRVNRGWTRSVGAHPAHQTRITRGHQQSIIRQT